MASVSLSRRRALALSVAGVATSLMVAPVAEAAPTPVAIPDPLIRKMVDDLKANALQSQEARRREEADIWAAGYFEGEEGAIRSFNWVNVERSIVNGALYDFMGWLTTRDEPIVVGRSHTVYAIMESFEAWAKERGLNLDVADVAHWQTRLRA